MPAPNLSLSRSDAFRGSSVTRRRDRVAAAAGAQSGGALSCVEIPLRQISDREVLSSSIAL